MYFLDDSVFLNNFVQFWLAILGDKISSRSNGIGHFPEGVLFFQCMHLKKFKKRLKGTFKVQVFLRTKKYSSGRFCQIFVAFLEKWPVRFHQIFGLLFLLDNSSPVLYGPFFCLAINDEVSNFWQKNAHPRRYGRSLTLHSMKVNTRNICILFQKFIVLAAIKWKIICHTRLWKQNKLLSFKRWHIWER